MSSKSCKIVFYCTGPCQTVLARTCMELVNNRIQIVCKSCYNRVKPCLNENTRALFVYTHATCKSYRLIDRHGWSQSGPLGNFFGNFPKVAEMAALLRLCWSPVFEPVKTCIYITENTAWEPCVQPGAFMGHFLRLRTSPRFGSLCYTGVCILGLF